MRTLPAATALAVLFSSAALTVAPTASADSTKVLPVASSADIVVDGVHQRVFISDPTNGKIVVTDYYGIVRKQFTNLPGVQGLELSADSGTLYGAVRDADKIVAIDTATETESARYPVGDAPVGLALAGGRLWFGYGAAGDGDIGSLDLSGEEPVVALDQDTTHLWYYAPVLDAAPGSGALVAGEPGGSKLAVYDVSSGTASRTAAVDTGGGNMGDLAVTPDGQRVVVASGSPYHHQVFKTSDLTADGTYASDTYPNSVAIAPDGTVAAGIDGIYEPDIYIYEPGSTTSVREYDFPNTGSGSGGDELPDSGLAWAPDGSRLFAVTYNDEGVYSLRTLDAPTRALTTLTVNAPATATRAKKLTVKGKITSKAAFPAGVKLTVTRTDLESTSGKALAAVTVAADGSYGFSDTPPAGGKVKYTVKYAGDADHTAASASDTVEVSRATPTLTLDKSRKTYSYGADVKFTAHLGTTYKNRKVEIWADPYGSDRPNKLVKSGTVNSQGNLSATVDLKRDTKLSVKFAGDSRYKARTVTNTVYTKVKISSSISGHYKTQTAWGHKYHFVRKSKDPVLKTVMTYYPNRQQRLQLEYYYDGAWRDWGAQYFELGTSGGSNITLTGTPTTNIRFRFRSEYRDTASGDNVNTTTYGAWKYFIFTD
ncbi:Ig-like domain repeat protein [Streptomyces scabiei]|uniref:Ig-like domain repeat protein n=1 Tax=Streptomyces scabiei TaxID=1930 RepID=UPI001B315FA6|nr:MULTISPECIES: Ig-like domain repeat protein [Streptomyces]MBP5868549.1 Ig-like domain repeat protein [Streptomyces sp. LBUM 1485]MBP5915527.1 Ig-like domain repeat protein [Streptomyces sp. LBUM 1486]MDX3033000.1 Ig-like domain repeat protein [Streptomyces scabiei]MDX3208762.1 Ig-like domain repeat protein [Streptomyces scabiei]QTU55135.1 Ig-like domain repeat protein [Streptomyces sp. LBUM 1480]